MRSTDSSPDKRIVAVYEATRVEEATTTGQRSLHATKAFNKGEMIASFAAQEERSSPTFLTLQKEDEVHISLSPPFLQYVNHACSPSAFFDTTEMEFIALKEIAAGEELTFFYPSTEWEMAQRFHCRCGSGTCLGTIEGAAFLPEGLLEGYRLTDFIRRKLKERREQRA